MWLIWLSWNFHKLATKLLDVVSGVCDLFFILERFKGTGEIFFWRQKFKNMWKLLLTPLFKQSCYKDALSDMTARSILESVGALYGLFTAAVMVVPGWKMSLESTGFSYLMKVSRKKSSIPIGSGFFLIKTINWVSNQYLPAFTIPEVNMLRGQTQLQIPSGTGQSLSASHSDNFPLPSILLN